MAKNLILIDLQEGFLASKRRQSVNRLKKEVVKQIKQAKKGRRPIIIVEYIGEGPTVDWVWHAVGSYENFHIKRKSVNNAAHTLGKLFKTKEFSNKHIICGVNTHYCVGATLKTLIHRGHDLEVSWKGVDCEEDRPRQRRFLENLELKVLWN